MACKAGGSPLNSLAYLLCNCVTMQLFHPVAIIPRSWNKYVDKQVSNTHDVCIMYLALYKCALACKLSAQTHLKLHRSNQRIIQQITS